MKEYRILFTGVGRRVELMQAFRQAAVRNNINLKIYGCDMSDTAPALMYCDYSRFTCGMRDKEYISQLLKICKDDNIDLLIPTIDTDLLILANNKDEFNKIGTKVLVSAPDKIALCRDKNLTTDFFLSCEVSAPETVNDCAKYKGPYPCFIKPKDGSSSINTYKVENEEELPVYAERVNDYIVQPFIDGEEYTIDVFCDLDSNPVYIVPRQRLAVRSGEVLKTKIDLKADIIEECKRIIYRFKPIGQITIQLIRQKDTNQNYYIEINPRFGGGAPLSIKAGADFAEATLKILDGEKLQFNTVNIMDGAVYSRFDQSVCVSHGNNGVEIKGVIFDLDDTLYSEKAYVRSGYKAVANVLVDVENVEERLWNYFQSGKPAIDALLEEENITDIKVRENCVNIYRSHKPDIQLYDGVVELLNMLKDKGIKVGIITDGRVEGQRNKISALGLESLVDDILITDELGGVQFRKPNDISFRIMQCRWKLPYSQMVYVGDNVTKDFQAPLQLGMKAIHLKNTDGIYTQEMCYTCPQIEIISDINDLFLMI